MILATKQKSMRMRHLITGILLLGSLVQIEIAQAQDRFQDCSNINQNRYPTEYRACLRMEIAGGGEVDCVECLFSETEKTNPWVEALGVVAGPLAFLGSAYLGYKGQKAWANAYSDTNAHWAGAYTAGQEACSGRISGYQQYMIERGANPITPTQFEGLNAQCNGQGFGQYAGMGGQYGNGYGGYGNAWGSAGYSSGFMSGMVGPYYGCLLYTSPSPRD